MRFFSSCVPSPKLAIWPGATMILYILCHRTRVLHGNPNLPDFHRQAGPRRWSPGTHPSEATRTIWETSNTWTIMKNMKNLLPTTLPAIGLLFGLAISPAQGQGLPAGEGAETYELVCGSCHGADIVVGSTGSRAAWEETVEAMRARGAYGTDEEFETVVKYLSKYFGMPVNVNTATADELQKQFMIPADQAEAIVAYRDANGDFKTVEEFLMVDGIDKEDFQLMADRIQFEEKKKK